MMSTSDVKDESEIFRTNPYESHPSLSATEADVLWEYAKLAQHIKTLIVKTRQLSEEPDQTLVSQLRVLERKMGLVLTLYQASVWAVINEQPVVDTSSSIDSADMTIRQ